MATLEPPSVARKRRSGQPVEEERPPSESCDALVCEAALEGCARRGCSAELGGRQPSSRRPSASAAASETRPPPRAADDALLRAGLAARRSVEFERDPNAEAEPTVSIESTANAITHTSTLVSFVH